MSKSIEIDRHDYCRVVLTEVQPYELPFILTNEGFYRYIYKSEGEDGFIIKKLFGLLGPMKPFNFNIVKTNESVRGLSLIHPYNQYEFCGFYRKYNELITHRCSGSDFSLRYPSKIAHSYYRTSSEKIESKVKDEGVDLLPEKDGSTPIYASSFFSYKKYNFLYKFYDSYEFHRIERKFSRLHKFDISKCFDNLSTDMLPSAITGEDRYKEDNNAFSFEESFSKNIEGLNFGRTHGIVIGPEFSRVYAEILLQHIDKRIKFRLLQEGLNFMVDYEIRRYVDDYFVFYNDDSVVKKIKSLSVEELSKYKLFINESKDEYFDRPFITGITQAKLEIKYFFEKLLSPIEMNTKLHEIRISSNFYYSSKVANSNLTKIKSIVKSNGIGYESISGYFLTIVRKVSLDIEHIGDKVGFNEDTSEKLARFLLVLIELSYFIYSMDSRVRATYLLSETIIHFSKIGKKLDYDSEVLIADKIISESKFSLRHISSKADGVEALNLAIALHELNKTSRMSICDVRTLLGMEIGMVDLNYFQIVVGLYFIKDDEFYNELKLEISSLVKEKLKYSKKPFRDSELTHLIFDVMSCPYLSTDYKKGLLGSVLDDNCIENVDFDDLYSILTENEWFVDWKEVSISRLLKKKELRSAY